MQGGTNWSVLVSAGTHKLHLYTRKFSQGVHLNTLISIILHLIQANCIDKYYGSIDKKAIMMLRLRKSTHM